VFAGSYFGGVGMDQAEPLLMARSALEWIFMVRYGGIPWMHPLGGIHRMRMETAEPLFMASKPLRPLAVIQWMPLVSAA